ncbi:Na/Pi cotransporter family protein [uncultured Mailhella sp.]|uniref:Na/Pi cotransporter family protein n=1 Tax=uncultured Mailhella sp. TaxID=1981031 RepID=UPI0025EF2897|nr:Na/Pi cotransporter family protein [uncultured Mailhella sp.]
MSFFTAMQLLGGVGIFLYAIKLISESLQMVAGERLRNIIGMFTKTPVMGVFLGTAVTMVIQSSSATTVMTVSFVDAGLMNLMQAIGVIMGANIGTTITGQILAFRVKDLAYLFVIVGVLLIFVCSSKKLKHIGEGLLGFGLLFIGMQTMESSMAFLRDRQDIFLAFSDNPLLGLAAGMFLTLLVQSSSATVGLTIALGVQGLLPLEAAIPIIFGDNIGTTITAVLAALGTGRAARQACAAHVLFNVIGVCIWLPLMPLWIGFIEASSSSIGHQIANAHTMFNICNTILFLPFVRPFAALIRKIIPDAERVDRRDAVYLDPLLIQRTPVVAVSAVKHECRHMGEVVLELLERTEKVFFEHKEEEKEEVLLLEEKLDGLEEAIRSYASDIMQSGLDGKDAETLEACVVSAGDLERIGDKGKRLIDFYEYRKKRGDDFSSEAMKEVRALFHETRRSVRLALAVFDAEPFTEKDKAALDALADRVREQESVLRASHASRLSSGHCSPEAGLVFIDVLGAIEQMAYRARKIADHMSGQQNVEA